MTLSAPSIDFRAATSAALLLSSLTLSGSGSLGAVPVGSASNLAQVRIYNNFSHGSVLADAANCVLAVYDNAVTQFGAVITPVVNAWVQVRWTFYDGASTGQDSQFYPIGGSQKHAMPAAMNSSTIGGGNRHYAEFQIQVVVPSNATGGTYTPGLWVEYDYNL